MAATKSRLGRGLDSLISGGGRSGDNAAEKPKSPSPAASRKSAARKKSTPSKKTAAKKSAKTAPAAKATATPAPAAQVPPAEPEPKTGLKEIPIRQIVPNPHQPRREFEETALKELAESIRSEGLLQPIVVRLKDEGYELIAGERRWRACQLLKMKQIPARVLETSETSSAVLSLIENLQREDLNPIEESMGYASLIREFGLTQEAVAERVGKSRAAIANALRLLQLNKEIQGYISRGHLSVGHAKVLLGVENPETRLYLGRQILEHGWSVRETERQIERARAGGDRKTPSANGRSVPESEATAIRDLERRIASSLSTKVTLRHTPKKGKLIIEYHGNEDLQRLLDKMNLASF
ncbi:MAG: ParB/RepB/Spo0J family partition protein [Opitutales bacterium]|nr:ParB/RepB/Spo0J family partition protein [Opitutales bacterium]